MSLTLKINDQKPVVEETTATEQKPVVTDIVATGEKSVVVGEQEMTADDLAWLNDEDDFVFEDLFGEDTATLELENAKQLELKDAAENKQHQVVEEKLNGFEEGLNRLKKQRAKDELTPEEASDLIEELLTKMATAADEDAQTIKSNLAKQKLQRMCEVEKVQKGQFLIKKVNNERFNKLYMVADFPDKTKALKSYWNEIEKEVDGEKETTMVFDSKKALNGTLKLLDMHKERPAMSKISILKECVDQINSVTNQQWFVNFNGLNILKTWLSKNPDGSLPNLTLRTEILKCLQQLPIGKDKLRSSQLGKAIKALLTDQRETLQNRKICQGLIQKWLANVLETENSIRNHMEVQQYELNKVAGQKRKRVMQKSKSQAELDRQLKIERARQIQKESNERRHPQMFGKANNVFRLLPKSEIKSLASEASAYRQTRKGRIGKTAGEMRALRPATKHMHVSIAGSGINLAFSSYVGQK
jgi:transcription factor SPN1